MKFFAWLFNIIQSYRASSRKVCRGENDNYILCLNSFGSGKGVTSEGLGRGVTQQKISSVLLN